MKITIKQYWTLRKDVEIYNREIGRLLENLKMISPEHLSSKVVYDLAQLVVQRETAEMITNEYNDEEANDENHMEQDGQAPRP